MLLSAISKLSIPWRRKTLAYGAIELLVVAMFIIRRKPTMTEDQQVYKGKKISGNDFTEIDSSYVLQGLDQDSSNPLG